MTDYDKIFMEALGLSLDDLADNPTFASTSTWDSLGHMELIAALEDAYGIMFEPDEITHFESYDNGKKILAGHGIEVG